MATKVETDETLNPRTTKYEFLGPPGAFMITVGVPIMAYALYFGCSETSNGCPPPLNSIPDRFMASIAEKASWANLWDSEAFLIYLAWYAFCVVSWALLPGDWIKGVTLRTGEKKDYKINGMFYDAFMFVPSFTGL